MPKEDPTDDSLPEGSELKAAGYKPIPWIPISYPLAFWFLMATNIYLTAIRKLSDSC